jgi:hypothetical protein
MGFIVDDSRYKRDEGAQTVKGEKEISSKAKLIL